MAEHIAVPTLVLAVDQFSWMMSSAAGVPTSCWSAPVGQSYCITAFMPQMLVLVAKVR